MALDLTKRKTNDEKERDGIWANFADTPTGYLWWLPGEPTPVGEDVPVGKVRVARAGNSRAREYRAKALRPYKRIIRQLGELPEAVAEKVLNETLAHTILVDWADIRADGEEVEFSPETALEVLQSNEDFRALVLDISSTAQAYRDEDIEESAELLGNVSDGS